MVTTTSKNDKRGAQFRSLEPSDIMRMLWHHSRKHVSPDLFKRAILSDFREDFGHSSVLATLSGDFDRAMVMLFDVYSRRFGRRPSSRDLEILLGSVDFKGGDPSRKYARETRVFFEFWREWTQIQHPSPDQPACYVGATVVACARKLWDYFWDTESRETFTAVLLGATEALESCSWARKHIAETRAEIESKYQKDLGRGPLAVEIEWIADATVDEAEADKEDEKLELEEMKDQRWWDMMAMGLLSEEEDDEEEEDWG